MEMTLIQVGTFIKEWVLYIAKHDMRWRKMILQPNKTEIDVVFVYEDKTGADVLKVDRDGMVEWSTEKYAD